MVRIDFKKKFSKFNLFKFAFWLIIILSIASFISVLFLHNQGHITANTNDISFSYSIFSNSLSLIFSIIGFLIAIIVFLVQYIGTKFDSHELEKSPISNMYFLILLLILASYIVCTWMKSLKNFPKLIISGLRFFYKSQH